MKKYQENSLARIKLWLDIPFYLQYVNSKEELDELIISCGLSEDELKESHNKTSNLETINPSIMSQVDWCHTDTKYERDASGHQVAKTVTSYHYSVPKEKCVNLIRAILNKKNPELAKYGYTLYSNLSGIGDFYVKLDDNYALYINFHSYMMDDYDAVLAGIYKGIINVTDCTKALTIKHQNAALKKLRKSDVFINILKLNR